MNDDQKVTPEPVEVKITTPPAEVDDEERTVERTETTESSESTETVTEPGDSDD